MSDILRGTQEAATPRSLAIMAESLCLPVSLLQSTLMPGLTHPHAAVREGCARLLSCILDQLTKHVEHVAQQKLLSPSGVNNMKQLLAARLAQVINKILIFPASSEVFYFPTC